MLCARHILTGLTMYAMREPGTELVPEPSASAQGVSAPATAAFRPTARLSTSMISTLQRSAGNAAVARLIQRQQAAEEEEEPWTPPAWAPIEGEGEPRSPEHEAEVVKIKGLTEGKFDGGTFKTIDKVSKGEGCEDGCKPKDCTTVSGTVESTFTANPKVTLPKVSDFPGLTPCQKKRVQEAIDTKIAPHEQEHVTRFKTYDGKTSLPFSLTGCKDKLRDRATAEVSRVHREENKRRGDAADTLSLAIDPFEVTVDLDCKEPETKSAEAGGAPDLPEAGGEPYFLHEALAPPLR